MIHFKYHFVHWFIHHHEKIWTHKWPAPTICRFTAQMLRASHQHRGVTGSNSIEAWFISEVSCVVYSFVCLQTALGDNVWLQHKLIESLVSYNDVEEAARWAMFYRLPQSSLPLSVKRALDSWLVCSSWCHRQDQLLRSTLTFTPPPPS